MDINIILQRQTVICGLVIGDNPAGIGQGLVIKKGGNVGIGTTSPATNLEVAGSSNGDHVIISGTQPTRGLKISTFAGGGASTDAGVTFNAQASSNAEFDFKLNGASKMVIDTTGYVGIGTTGPDRNLHVETAGDTYFRIAGNRGNGNDLHIGNMEFENTFGTNGVIAEIRGITGNTGTQSTMGQLAFWTDDGTTYAERMRIQQNGNVGIGTTSPTAKLTIAGAGSGSQQVMKLMANSGGSPSDGDAAYIQFAASDNGASDAYGARIGGGRETPGAGGLGYLFFATGANSPTERIRITNAGNVGIGTSSPNALLQINATGKATTGNPTFEVITSGSEAATYGSQIRTLAGNRAALLVEHSANAGDGRALVINSASATGNILEVQDGGTPVFIVKDGGDVGIGTSSPNAKLEVTGDVIIDLSD